MSRYVTLQVMLTDTSDAAIANGRQIIEKSLSRVARKAHPDSNDEQRVFIDKIFANLSTTTDAQQAVQETDLIVEAIVENIKIKQELFARLDKIAHESTIFATNTSSLSVTEIASTTSAKRQARFAGLHYFNPVSPSACHGCSRYWHWLWR